MSEDKFGTFEKIVTDLKVELLKLRTGRANPAMIEEIKVDYYGTPTPLKQLGSISVPEPRQLLVQPWDKNALAPIEKALRDAGLGFNPVNEGDKIRITLPELNEERRRELTKVAARIAEEARVRVRNVREEIWKETKKALEEGEIREDDKFKRQEELQKQVDEQNKKIKEIAEAKEKDIMTI